MCSTEVEAEAGPGFSEDALLARQLAFYREKRAGCLFAAAAAKDPARYGWTHCFSEADEAEIDRLVRKAIEGPATTMVSLLFAEVRTRWEFLQFLGALRRSETLVLEQVEVAFGSTCFGFRARVGDLLSYVTGFGDFEFLPETRRAPLVELVMRVKPRPDYDYVFKEAPPGVIHLADLDMRGMDRDRLWGLWEGSFAQTERMLGKKPDLRSAARTTYSLPAELVDKIP